MRISRNLFFLLLLLLVVACSSKDSTGESDEQSAEQTEEESAEPAEPTVGASCEHLGSTDGAFACEDNNVIFCSVLTDHKWEIAQDMFQCKDGKTCTELEGNQTSCQ